MKKVKISICTLLLLAAASIAYSVWAGDDERENIWIIDKPGGGGSGTVTCVKNFEYSERFAITYCSTCNIVEHACASLNNPDYSTCQSKQ